MKPLVNYINLCHKLRNIKLPKMRFKILNERYKHIYKIEYDLDEDDINKCNFFIFILSFSFMAPILYLLANINLWIIIFISIISSLSFSHKFNSLIYNRIQNEEKQLNAAIYLIKIYFSLIQNSLSSKIDHIVYFINFMKDYNLTISRKFENMISLIQLGEKPETLISKLITPSKDLNQYIKNLLITDFKPNTPSELLVEKTLEKRFNIFLKQIDSKLSIIFFIGLFFPLSLSILIIFQKVSLFYLFPILFLYYLILRMLNKKFLKEDFLLIGMLREHTKEEKEKFDQFLIFLTSFALNLKKKIAPELAFMNAYSNVKAEHGILRLNFENQISKLLNLSVSFDDFVNNINIELNSPRYKLIFNVLTKIISVNAYLSNEKIFEILTIISKHQKLEKRLEIIFKGEKFKILLFLFLLPIIIGGIGGIFPMFNMILGDLTLGMNYAYLALRMETVIIFTALLISVIISSNYFLNITKYKRKTILLLLSSSLYIFIFFISLLTVFTLI